MKMVKIANDIATVELTKAELENIADVIRGPREATEAYDWKQDPARVRADIERIFALHQRVDAVLEEIEFIVRGMEAAL